MLNTDAFTEGMAYGRVSPTGAVACLDWLSAVTSDPVDIDRLIDLSEPVFKGRGYIFKYSGRPWKIWFNQFKDGKVVFSVNPSHFVSGWDLLESLREALGGWALKARLTRVDCTVTLPLPFQQVFIGLDFGSKRSVERYLDNPKGRSVYVGRKGRRNELVIYDKRKESKNEKSQK